MSATDLPPAAVEAAARALHTAQRGGVPCRPDCDGGALIRQHAVTVLSDPTVRAALAEQDRVRVRKEALNEAATAIVNIPPGRKHDAPGQQPWELNAFDEGLEAAVDVVLALSRRDDEGGGR